MVEAVQRALGMALGQLRLKAVVLVLQAVGVGAELRQAADDLVEQGAEHAPSLVLAGFGAIPARRPIPLR